jgi:two-component system phosphate regulon sensor histidine kinase PhoR
MLTALLSILILLGLQFYWLAYSYKIEEALFSKSVRIAMNQSIDALSKNQGMCQSMQKSISCDSSFIASRNQTSFVWQNLDSQIRKELARYDIDSAFELAIFKGKDTLRINNLDKIVGSSCFRLSLNDVLKMSDTEIGVIFPNHYNFFLHRMGLMFLGSVLLILLIGFSFSLVLRYYLREITLSNNIKEMVNNLAHEFRTPISSIALAAKMIQHTEEATSNPKIKRYTDTIVEENKRLQNQSDRILQLAAIEQNNLEYKFEVVDFEEIINQASNAVAIQIEQRRGRITKNAGDGPYHIFGDHHELLHVMINLLINAIKYSPQEPEITVNIKKSTTEVLVEVIDQGIGMASGEKKKIFDKYYRVPSGDQHNIKGFGIGLYYVNEIVKAHQAQIEVESEPGKGSKFSLIFLLSEISHGTKD